MYQIIQKRKIWLSVSSVFVSLSIVLLFMYGLNFGIDFTGGSLLEVRFLENRPSIGDVQDAVSPLNLESLIVQPVGEDGMILRFQEIHEDTHQEILGLLNDLTSGETSEPDVVFENDGAIEIETSISNVDELRFDAVGPSIGKELRKNSISTIVVVLIFIVAYIAWAFRGVSKPVVSWKYGLTAIIALFHDVILTLGVFAVLGEFYGVEINAPFVAAILTVLGYSVNDTIVVFDRVRENLPRSSDDFENTVNMSVNSTIKRSINTSVTTLLVLGSILFLGGETIRSFVLALSIGVFVGTYSSIFLASPILVVWERLKK